MRESRRGGRVNAVIWCLVIAVIDKAIRSIRSISISIAISAAAVTVEVKLQAVRIHADRQTPLVKGKKKE